MISPDTINDHSPVILIAAITSQNTDRVYPFEALIEPPEGGLTRRSKALLIHLRSVSKRRLSGQYGAVGPATMRQVETAVRVATGLTPV